MIKLKDINYMRIHFTWINWSLRYQKDYRKKISEASDEQVRKEIAKHLGLDNAFLVRRNKDPAFSGLIYYKILSKKEIYSDEKIENYLI